MTGSAAHGAASWPVGRRLRSDYLQRYADIENEARTYRVRRGNLRAYKREILLALLLITLLLLFATTWVALYLSKQITGPIQALAEATQEIARGNFTHSVAVPMQTTDELGTLITSFNQMTTQLGEGQRQINDFTRNLQQAVEDRESRRKLMEAILEHIPTGVVSLDPGGAITRTNSAVHNIFGDRTRRSDVSRSTGGGSFTGDSAVDAPLVAFGRGIAGNGSGRGWTAGSRRGDGKLLGAAQRGPGFVVVIDDITRLLRAQRAAAWQEVAQRIAHEIKNPLTPVQLSAQRLLRHLDKTAGSRGRIPAPASSESLVAECAGLIEREVHVLESLVDEFSQFARFLPHAWLRPRSEFNRGGRAGAISGTPRWHWR